MQPGSEGAGMVDRGGSGGLPGPDWLQFGPDAVLPANAYRAVAGLARRANAVIGPMVSLVLPVEGASPSPDETPDTNGNAETIVFVEVSAAAAFALLAALPLREPAPAVLESCGLSLADLSLREAMTGGKNA